VVWDESDLKSNIYDLDSAYWMVHASEHATQMKKAPMQMNIEEIAMKIANCDTVPPTSSLWIK
jgi:hypothetical protein